MKTRILGLIVLILGATAFFSSAVSGKKTAPGSKVVSLLRQMASDADLIVAKRVKGKIPLDPQSGIWQKAKETVVALVPQTTAVPWTRNSQRSELSVRALYNKKELGLLLSWSDPTKDERTSKVEQFRDAVAAGFPMNYGKGAALPYIGMGNKGRPVNIWHWKASWQADLDQGYQGIEAAHAGMVPNVVSRHFLPGAEAGSPLSQRRRTSPVENLMAEGFGTLTSVPSEGLTGKGVWNNGRWRVVVKRPLKPQAKGNGVLIKPKKGLVPVTFAVWDGSSEQRDGMKGITRWRFLRFDKENVPLASLESLIIGPLPGADAKKGKQLVAKLGCVSCHSLPGEKTVLELGPNLTRAGAIHRPEYLLESIQNPNAVIVPQPGYFDPESGISTMPTFDESLQEKDAYDMVEYLRILK